MSLQNHEQVRAAVETLETSYSYEPARWMDAYRDLRALEREFEQQLKPHSWIAKLFGIFGLVWFVVMIVLSFGHIGGDPMLSGNVWLNSLFSTTLWFAPVMLIGFGRWLTLQVAARHHPLLLHKSRIEEATHRFRALAGEPVPEDNA